MLYLTLFIYLFDKRSCKCFVLFLGKYKSISFFLFSLPLTRFSLFLLQVSRFVKQLSLLSFSSLLHSALSQISSSFSWLDRAYRGWRSASTPRVVLMVIGKWNLEFGRHLEAWSLELQWRSSMAEFGGDFTAQNRANQQLHQAKTEIKREEKELVLHCNQNPFVSICFRLYFYGYSCVFHACLMILGLD